jgi:hypothetical protein
LYVGIHANALKDASHKGCEVWVLTLNENLMKQNKLVGAIYADEGDFIDPDDIDRTSQGFIMALSRQLENEPFSRFAAEECCKQMSSYGLVNLGVKAGTVYTVLYYSECPGAIVELGYLTNDKDYAYLTSKNAKKEMATAVCNAIVTYFKILLIDNMMLNAGIDSLTAITVCLTLLLTVIAAKVLGCTLPIFAKKLGADPAVMASPLITTLVDAGSLIIYFSIASMLLGI